MDKQNIACIYNGILFILKRKEILTYSTTWMNTEDIVLNEISHKRTNTVTFHLYKIPRAVKFKETKYNGGCQEFGEGGMGNSLNIQFQ